MRACSMFCLLLNYCQKADADRALRGAPAQGNGRAGLDQQRPRLGFAPSTSRCRITDEDRGPAAAPQPQVMDERVQYQQPRHLGFVQVPVAVE